MWDVPLVSDLLLFELAVDDIMCQDLPVLINFRLKYISSTIIPSSLNVHSSTVCYKKKREKQCWTKVKVGFTMYLVFISCTVPSCHKPLFAVIVDVNHTYWSITSTSRSLTQISDDDERMSVGSRGSVRVSITQATHAFKSFYPFTDSYTCCFLIHEDGPCGCVEAVSLSSGT